MIEVSHLSKSYGSRPAVQDLSFTVPDGQIYGLLGPNGAGKSTIMNILTGYLAPTEGEVKVAGFRLPEQAQRAKACVGYLPEQPPLYPEMTVQEYLDFVAELKGVKHAQRKQQVLAAARRTGLEEVLPRVIRSLSKGYRQRVGIAQALLGSPQLIILDEPTVGLDPAQVIEIRNLIRELGKAHTVILSSHILSEVQAVCQQVLILEPGQPPARYRTGRDGHRAGRCAQRAGHLQGRTGKRRRRPGHLYRRERGRRRPPRCRVPGTDRERLHRAGACRREPQP